MPSKRRYIVDPASRVAGKEKRGKLTPADQVKFLQRLARFAKRESLDMVAVFSTKELRAVQHGGDFQGVRVFFEPDAERFHDMVSSRIQELGEQGTHITVITDDNQLESTVQGVGVDAMRMNTFSKALDLNADSRNGSGGNARASRSNRRSRSRKRPKQEEDAPKLSRQGGSDTAAVRELIDLVD